MASASGTRSQAVKAIKALSRARRPTIDDPIRDLFHFGMLPAGFLKGNLKRPKREHRSLVLILGALLDQSLEGAILTKLPGIKPGNEGYLFDSDNAPFSEFDPKIRIAFALGLLGERARSDLSLIRTIRNAFGHSRMDLNFETPEIAEGCKHLTVTERSDYFVARFDACQTFVDACSVYSLSLMEVEDSRGVPDEKAARVLDLPWSPSPETPK